MAETALNEQLLEENAILKQQLALCQLEIQRLTYAKDAPGQKFFTAPTYKCSLCDIVCDSIDAYNEHALWGHKR